MKKLIIGLLFMSVGLQAQTEIVINKNIQALKVSTGLEVELITSSDENKIEASQNVLNAINYKVVDYELRLSLSLEDLIDGNVPLKLKVYTKNIDRINALQGSIIQLGGKIKSNNFSLRASEGSKIWGEFDTDNIEIKVYSGAIIDIKGKTKSQNVAINTGGIYEGKNFLAEDTVVKVSYGGEAQVFASNNCEAKVFVGGEVNIYGRPKYMNEKISFGGDIRVIKK